MSKERSPLIFEDPGDQTAVRHKSKSFVRVYLICGIFIAVVAALIVIIGLLIGHFAIQSGNNSQEICSNPPLLLISTDGFWAEYLQRNLTPLLLNLSANGVRATYMRSAFPTKTFPNHYSIVTGLYPESHGIVNNAFYDSKLKDKFSIGSPTVNDPKWWKGEPIWVTAAKNKLKSGVYFWPGSEVPIAGFRPTYYFNYNWRIPFDQRVDTVLSWFDLPKAERPQYMSFYMNEPDHAGHTDGPFSSRVNDSLKNVDEIFVQLWEGLERRGISQCVNIIIVSDHGMSAYNSSDLVIVKDFIPSDLYHSANVTAPTYGTTLTVDVAGGKSNVEKVYNAMVVNGTDKDYPFRVFRTDNLPLRLHAGHFHKERYGPIYAIGDVHSYVMLFRPKKSPLAGNHGFDNLEKEMQAIFIAHGPAFKKNYVSQAFDNVQLYSLMCGLLNITAAPNNATVGSLYHLLDPQTAKKFPPAQSFGGSPGVNTSCPFPQDRAIFESRSVCDECICDSTCSQTSVLNSNNVNFNLTSTQERQFQSKHLPWGSPSGGRGDGACLLTQATYVSLYSNNLHIPLWSAYTINKDDGNITATSSCLHSDPRIVPTSSTNCSTYMNRNHFIPVPDFQSDTDPDGLVFVPLLFPFGTSIQRLSMGVFSNVVPQWSSFSNGVWLELAGALNQWLDAYGTLNIVVGSVLDSNRDGQRDPDSKYPSFHDIVAIPSHYYVIVTRCTKGMDLNACAVGDIDVHGMLFQHPIEPGDYSQPHQILRYALTPLRDIEKVTGVNFFPHLSAEDQNFLELRLVDQLWPVGA